VHSPNHAVGYDGTLTQITHCSIHCHEIRNTSHDLLRCSATRVCSLSLLSQSVTRSRYSLWCVCSSQLHFSRAVFMQWTAAGFVFGTWMKVRQCWCKILRSKVKG